MTQPAQSSGHEYFAGEWGGWGSCTCGQWKCPATGQHDCREQHAAHVASVAQAVKPSANYVNDPDYQADVLLAEADALKKFTDYFVANYPGPDTIIYDPHWHAPKIFRAAKAALKLVPAQPRLTSTLGVHEIAPEIYRKAVYPVPAQPPAAAKPAEDGLEAQVTAWLFTQFGKRFGWTNEGDIESLANFIRTHQAARERELREKLEGLSAKWKQWAGPPTEEARGCGNTDDERNEASNDAYRSAADEIDALLASHWPAQKEGK